MTPGLRTADERDLEAVLALWIESDAVPTTTDDLQSLRTLIAHNPKALIVAEDGGRVVGSVVAAWDGWRGSIYRLTVTPTHRRLGLGTRLLREAESYLKAVGAKRLQAIVVATDVMAVDFWETSTWDRQRDRLRFTFSALPSRDLR